MADKDFKSKSSQQPSGPRHGGPMAGMMPGQKPKDFKGTFLKLARFLKPHSLKFVIVFIFAILSTFFTVLGPRILGQATNEIADAIKDKAPVNFETLGNILILLLFLYGVSAGFRYLQQFIMAKVSQTIVYDMRSAVDKKMQRLPLKYFDSKTHGEILSRVTNDVDTVSNTLQQSITQIITAIVTLVGVLYMMFSISWILTIIALFTVPLSMVFTIKITKKSQKYFKGQQKSLGELSGHVEEMYGGHNIIKAYGKEKDSIEKFNEINKILYENSRKAQFLSGTMMPVLSFIGNIGYVLICVVGGIFVSYGRVTIGGIQAFIQYSKEFSHPIVQTAQMANILQSTIAAAERVFEVLEQEEEIPDVSSNDEYLNKEQLNNQYDCEFENVNFGYMPDTLVIKDLSIRVRKGQKVAIVGPTGAGKTTLVNLLMRFYEVNSGEIKVNGIPINSMKRSDLRRNFGMVLQDTWLFKGTIRDNIAYGKENATPEEIKQAAILARADHFIKTLSQGYDTVINEEGSNISSGQKQLLTIARAILANPQMLILDEATSSVDTRTELLIQKGMNELMKGRTSFVIAHRLSTIRDADIILVMNDGDIVEQGSHSELMQQNGFYADLYNSQFVNSLAV